MIIRPLLILLPATFSTLFVVTSAAMAEPKHPVFGLTSVEITPASGVGTPADDFSVIVKGIAGSALIPTAMTLSQPSPGVIEIALTTPGTAGATIDTPWQRSAGIFSIPLPPPFFQLKAGTYDFYVRGITGFGTGNEFVVGPELVVNDFVVIPEPSAALLVAASVLGTCHVRRRRRSN